MLQFEYLVHAFDEAERKEGRKVPSWTQKGPRRLIALMCSNRGFGFPTSAESKSTLRKIERLSNSRTGRVFTKKSPVPEDYHQFPRVSIHLSHRTHWPDTAAALLCYTMCMEMEKGSQPQPIPSNNMQRKQRPGKEQIPIGLFVICFHPSWARTVTGSVSYKSMQ